MTMYSFSVGYRGLSTWRKGERGLLVGVAAPRIRRAAGKASAIASSFFRSGWWGRKTPAEADLRLTNQRRLPTTPPVGALVVPNVSRHPTLGWWERYSTSTCRVVILFNARITSDNPSDVTLVSDEFSRFCLVLFVYALFGASVRLSTIVDVFFVVFYIFGKYPRTHLITFYLLSSVVIYWRSFRGIFRRRRVFRKSRRHPVHHQFGNFARDMCCYVRRCDPQIIKLIISSILFGGSVTR
jgi:hypothetical protein